MRWTGVRGLALGACAAGAIALLPGCGRPHRPGRQRRQRQDAVRGQVRLLPRARPAPARRASPARTSTRPSSARAGTASARARSRASCTARSSSPTSTAQVDPATGKLLPLMPAKLVTGEDAEDVAAYVASAAAKGGKDTGQLAQVGAAEAKGTAKAENGKLDDPGRPRRRAGLQVRQRRGAGRPARGRLAQRVLGRARHRGRGQRRQREGRGRLERRRLDASTPTSSPASTRSSARSPATARPAWRARSP